MRTLLRSLLVLPVLLVGIAAPAKAESSPHTMLQRASEEMFAVLELHRTDLRKNPQALYGLVEQVLSPHVDFPLMAQLVLGKYWRGADAAQRERFILEFKTLLVRFYVGALLEDPRKLEELLDFKDSLIQFHPAEAGSDPRRVRVRAEVQLPDSRVVATSFDLHHRGEEWKVYDVSVEGISLVTNYRSTFSSEIRQGGIDGLIDRLSTRNRELERGIARKG